MLDPPLQNVACPEDPEPLIVPARSPIHVPSGLAIQPPVSLIPPANVDVEFPVIVIPFVEERPSTSMPPVNVEVAVEVDVICPVVKEPIDAEPLVSDEKTPDTKRPMVEKNEVVVALVIETFVNVLVALDVADSEPMVRSPIDDDATYAWFA